MVERLVYLGWRCGRPAARRGRRADVRAGDPRGGRRAGPRDRQDGLRAPAQRARVRRGRGRAPASSQVGRERQEAAITAAWRAAASSVVQRQRIPSSTSVAGPRASLIRSPSSRKATMNSAPGRGSAAIRAAPSTQSDRPGPLEGDGARGSRRSRAVLPRVARAKTAGAGPSDSALTGIAAGPAGADRGQHGDDPLGQLGDSAASPGASTPRA